MGGCVSAGSGTSPVRWAPVEGSAVASGCGTPAESLGGGAGSVEIAGCTSLQAEMPANSKNEISRSNNRFCNRHSHTKTAKNLAKRQQFFSSLGRKSIADSMHRVDIGNLSFDQRKNGFYGFNRERMNEDSKNEFLFYSLFESCLERNAAERMPTGVFHVNPNSTLYKTALRECLVIVSPPGNALRASSPRSGAIE